MTRSWVLEHPGRCMTLNKWRTLHFHQRSNHDAAVRVAFGWLARQAKVPALGAACVHVHPLVRRAPLPDVAACATDVKAAIDGLVDAGVLPDDDPEHLSSVTFHAPQKAGRDALVLVVCEKQLAVGAGGTGGEG